MSPLSFRASVRNTHLRALLMDRYQNKVDCDAGSFNAAGPGRVLKAEAGPWHCNSDMQSFQRLCYKALGKLMPQAFSVSGTA
jgi:hypothetical protein